MSSTFDPYYEWLGIPAEDQPPTHYRLLGIAAFEVSATVIENAADRQMRYLRTLQNGPRGPISQQLLNEVSRARYTLLDEKGRAEYDEGLKGEVARTSPVVPPPTQTVLAEIVESRTDSTAGDLTPGDLTPVVDLRARIRRAPRSLCLEEHPVLRFSRHRLR
jgi:curved DNA-binding protein CbpA